MSEPSKRSDYSLIHEPSGRIVAETKTVIL